MVELKPFGPGATVIYPGTNKEISLTCLQSGGYKLVVGRKGVSTEYEVALKLTEHDIKQLKEAFRQFGV